VLPPLSNIEKCGSLRTKLPAAKARRERPRLRLSMDMTVKPELHAFSEQCHFTHACLTVFKESFRHPPCHVSTSGCWKSSAGFRNHVTCLIQRGMQPVANMTRNRREKFQNRPLGEPNSVFLSVTIQEVRIFPLERSVVSLDSRHSRETRRWDCG
jgi:hypothetical protein